MSNSRKQKKRSVASKSSSGGKPEKASAPEFSEGWRWPLADRPLSMEEFAERAAALRREIRPSIDSTKIIRAHRDGCCCELDECSFRERKEQAALSNSSRGDSSTKASAPKPGEVRQWPLVDRTLSMEEFAERSAALRRENRSSIDSTKIIRAHRDGCCCELDECCFKRDGGSKE